MTALYGSILGNQVISWTWLSRKIAIMTKKEEEKTPELREKGTFPKKGSTIKKYR